MERLSSLCQQQEVFFFGYFGFGYFGFGYVAFSVLNNSVVFVFVFVFVFVRLCLIRILVFCFGAVWLFLCFVLFSC